MARRPRLPPCAAVRRAFALALALVLAGCQSGYYDEYRAAHPGWQGGPPQAGASLEEVLAALHAPTDAPGIEVEVADLAIWRAEGEPWQPVSFEAIRSGTPRPGGSDYVVLATLRCRFERGLRVGVEVRHGYYLLPGGALAAWDHYAFDEACAVRDEFVAARGGLLPMEREAMRRVARRGSPRVGLAQAYRRGLAYVEAGRLSEARAMLAFGEPGFQAATARLRVGDRVPPALMEAGRLRGALMRALGVESP